LSSNPRKPSSVFDVSLVVRQWIYTNVLKHYHRGSPLDNAEENVVRGPLKRDVEPEMVAIKRQRGGTFLTMKNGAMPEISGLVM
jgi:hypothetical protein